MFSAQQLQQLESTFSQPHGRVQIIELDGATVVIKHQEAPRAAVGYQVLNVLAKLFQQPLLCAIPAPGGEQAQLIEQARLSTLKQAGVPVPELLHITPTWFAMSSAGTHSIDQLINDATRPQLEIWELALAAILDVHRKGQNLSQAFARNIMWQDGRIQFIDFEDDPVKTLPLAYAQSRDWLLYILSTAYQMQIDPATLAARWQHYLAQDSAEVQAMIARSAAQLAWLRHLPAKRKPWGRDVVSMQGAGCVLHELKRLRS
jgi:hypothetical protein